MRKILLFIMLFNVVFIAKAALKSNVDYIHIDTSVVLNNDDPLNKIAIIAKMPIKQIENLLGRKLHFKEKLGVRILKLKVKYGKLNEPRISSKKGKASLTFGILALVGLFIFFPISIPLGILAIVKGRTAIKENPLDADAKAGITLGIVSLSIIVLTILIALAIIFVFLGR